MSYTSDISFPFLLVRITLATGQVEGTVRQDSLESELRTPKCVS